MSKSLGPANDEGVPAEEFLAAKLIQNAKAKGLKWTANAFFRNAEGKAMLEQEYQSPDIAACCAYGAGLLEPDTHDEVQDRGSMITGNDQLDLLDNYYSEDRWGLYDASVSIGRIYRDVVGPGDV